MTTARIKKFDENAWTRQVLQLAKLYGWRSAHFRPARLANGKWVTPVQGDGKGFPDLILVRGSHIIAAELKMPGRKATDEQINWLLDLRSAGVETHIWLPEDWESIKGTLGTYEEQP